MDYRKLAALLSSVVSQLLLQLLFPTSTPHSISPEQPPSTSHGNLLSLLQHFLCSQEIAASLAFIPVSKKRKRTHLPEPSQEEDEDHELTAGHRTNLSELGMTQNPDSFKSCFNMTSTTFEWLLGLLEPLLECRDPVGSPLNLSADLRLGIGLYRLATGSNYSEIARRFRVPESATRFCAKQLCRVLCTNFKFWVAFPSPDELHSVSKSFQEVTGWPNCCGVINCVRFRIVTNDSDISTLREDSIAVQIVVDSSSRILSIVAGFRGNKSNSRVLKSSTLYKDVEEGKLLNSNQIEANGVTIGQYLIGDGGYPLLPWLMIPFVNVVSGSCEEKFNAEHRLMCLPASKTISSLKKWGVLSKPITEKFKAAVAFIGACSILHNVLLMRGDDSALCEETGDYHSLEDHYPPHEYSGDSGLEESLNKKKAYLFRNALATRAME